MKLTPDQFFGKYDQKGIDFDGYYGFQCMDLYRQFVKEVLDLPQSPSVVGAVSVWTTYLSEYFTRIDNTTKAIPVKGDIMIWSTGVGQYGHIAICKDAQQLEFTSFDQNWPVGSLCHFQKHNYKNVLGWLRVKPPTPAEPEPKPIPTPPVVEPKPPILPETPIDPCQAQDLLIAKVRTLVNSRWTWIGKKNSWKLRLSDLKKLL